MITGTSGSLAHTATVTVNVVVTSAQLRSAVTDGTGCSFGNQFRLILIQNNTNVHLVPVYELVTSNPGQFGYNVFFNGTAGTPVTLMVSIPYPFVTQGTNPIQVFSNFSVQSGCFTPVNNISSGFTFSASTISLTDYSTQALGSSVVVTISGTVPSSGMVYVTFHLKYGLKGAIFGKSNFDATNSTTGQIIIPNGASYTFSVSANSLTDSQIVTSQNTFKQDPGIAGILTDQFGNPIAGATVSLYDSQGSLVSITFTDKDGYFAFSFNLAHKSTFTVQFSLPNGTSFSQTLTVKPNHVAILDITATI
jgi:hypothetical protein